MAAASGLLAAKRNLRAVVKKTLSSVTTDGIASQSQTCVKTLLSLPEYQASRHISIFLSMPEREIDTSRVVEDSLEDGKCLYVPYIRRQPPAPALADAAPAPPPPCLMDMLSVFSLADYQSFEPDRWGIPSVPEGSVPARVNCLDEGEPGLDLIVMPGVAFDEGFRRLGHGKGYYDYFLARYKQVSSGDEVKGRGRMPVLIALALKEQVFVDGIVPVGPSDWLMDVIITGDGRLLRR